jgi:stage II sporulation protein GA (sporulation sigma-E factor processing peptidase)
VQTIYLDVLVALNLYITWAMLYCTGLLTHRKAGRLRMGLGALAGGLSALILLLPQLPGVLLGLLRLGLAGGIILIAFGWQGWRTFLRLTLIFFLVSLLFVGGMIGLYALGSPSGMAVRNGTVYFHVSALTLVLATLAGCLISKLLSVLLEHRMPERMTEAFRCTIRGRELLLQLYIDTGNRLTSFGKPVAVVSAAVLSGILPPEVIACAADITLAAALPEKLRGRLRLVSCRTAAGQKLLPALPAVLYRLRDGASFDCLVALTEEKCFGETDGVIGLLE